MELRGFIALLVGVLVALGTLAFASPPDQTWIAGFYDDADFDDAVLLITEYSFGSASVVVCDAAPFFVGVISVSAFEARPAPVPPSDTDVARAPPAV
jgi:hypothetical protein